MKSEREQRTLAHTKSYDYSKFKSKFTSLVIQQDHQSKEDQMVNDVHRKDFLIKIKNFGKMVQDLHPPKIDPQKKLEIELMVQKSSQGAQTARSSAHRKYGSMSIEAAGSIPELD